MSVVADVVAVPKTAVATTMKRPLFAIGMAFFLLAVVLAVETYRPGVITNPIRRFLGVFGIKPKAA